MRSRRVLELAVGVLAALLLGGGAVYATGPHDGPAPYTTGTGTSAPAQPCPSPGPSPEEPR